MPRTISSQCTRIAEEIQALEEELRDLKREQSSAPDNQQAYYKREIKKLLRELGLRRQQLRTCEEHHDPPPLRPDLFAYGVYAVPNHATRRLSVAAIIKNIGKAPVVGPFRIDLSVTEISGSITVQHVQVFEVPAGLVIHAEPVLTQDGVLAKIGGDVAIHYEYVTENMEVPLRYIDESPSYRYEIEFLVDSEHVVSESNEENNSFKTRRWFTTPSAVQRDKPFVIRSSEASSTGEPDDGTE